MEGGSFYNRRGSCPSEVWSNWRTQSWLPVSLAEPSVIQPHSYLDDKPLIRRRSGHPWRCRSLHKEGSLSHFSRKLIIIRVIYCFCVLPSITQHRYYKLCVNNKYMFLYEQPISGRVYRKQSWWSWRRKTERLRGWRAGSRRGFLFMAYSFIYCCCSC